MLCIWGMELSLTSGMRLNMYELPVVTGKSTLYSFTFNVDENPVRKRHLDTHYIDEATEAQEEVIWIPVVRKTD